MEAWQNSIQFFFFFGFHMILENKKKFLYFTFFFQPIFFFLSSSLFGFYFYFYPSCFYILIDWMAKTESIYCDSSFNDWRSSISSSSRQSYATDEGYHSDEKQRISWIHDSFEDATEQQHEQYQQKEETQHEHEQHQKAPESDREIPILKSTRTMSVKKRRNHPLFKWLLYILTKTLLLLLLLHYIVASLIHQLLIPLR